MEPGHPQPPPPPPPPPHDELPQPSATQQAAPAAPETPAPPPPPPPTPPPPHPPHPPHPPPAMADADPPHPPDVGDEFVSAQPPPSLASPPPAAGVGEAGGGVGWGLLPRAGGSAPKRCVLMTFSSGTRERWVSRISAVGLSARSSPCATRRCSCSCSPKRSVLLSSNTFAASICRQEQRSPVVSSHMCAYKQPHTPMCTPYNTCVCI